MINTSSSINRSLRFLTSSTFILVCLALMMVLVVIGTFAQVNMGAFAAQRYYFNSFWVVCNLGAVKLPVFPGGLTIGLLWLASIFAASLLRFTWSFRNLGILLSHLGIVLLILGQGITQLLSEESVMSIEEGSSSNYSELQREIELVLIDTSNPASHQVVSIPTARLVPGGLIKDPSLPFAVSIREFYHNSHLNMSKGEGRSKATQGIGPQIALFPAPPTEQDDETNIPSALVELKTSEKSLGIWLVSTGLQAPQGFTLGERKFEIYLRLKRRYFPFSLELKQFSHDIYPGTDIPKNFSSLVHVNYPEKNESRDVLIYMNHPLRFAGYTFYQASFGKNDTLSIFQVVRNPAWLTPYVSCVVVTVGLLLQFLIHLFSKSKRTV